MAKRNKVTGSPVGVITADIINININNSGLLLIKNLTSIIFLFNKKRISNGNWNEIPNNKAILIMN